MRAIALAALLLPTLVSTTPIAAQPTQSVSASSLQLVVFNRPGPRWTERESAIPLLLAHRDLYRRMTEEGEILFSGRFIGEPNLGMSIFDSKIDEADVRRRLTSDPAVVGGYIALEFRRIVQNFVKSAQPPQ